MITALPKPNYEVEFAVVRRAHIYRAGGLAFPSVTKILGIIDNGKSNALAIWARREALKLARKEFDQAITDGLPLSAALVDEVLQRADRQPEKLKDAAADLGTRVHEAIDAFVLGKEPVLTDDVLPGFNGFLSWLNTENLTIISGDIAVASREYGYGGRLDAVAVNAKGELGILDWKTSNALRDEYPLQVGAYSIAFEETYGLHPAFAKVVRFGKTDPTDIEGGDVNLPKAKLAFLRALRLHEAMNQWPLWQ